MIQMSGSSDDESDDLNLRVEDSGEDGSDDEVSSGDSDGDQETGSDYESGDEVPTGGSSRPDQPPPSEWIEFNKKVISMRPLFKSARVQFANKLTRQIKLLRNRKGDELQAEKCRRKAERLVEEISYVNRLKQDIIAKFALLHSKEEITKIMNDPGSTMEYRVKAKVAAMPKISKAADDYHQAHPDWRETLIKLIQLAGSKMKKKRRKMRGKGKSSRKKNNNAEEANKKRPKPKFEADDDGTGRFDESNFPEPPPGLEHMVANTDSSDQEGSDQEVSGGEVEWDPPEVSRYGDSERESSPSEESLNLLTKNMTKIRTVADFKGPNNQRTMPLQNIKSSPSVEANPKTVKRRGDELREPPKKKMTKTISEKQEKFGFEKGSKNQRTMPLTNIKSPAVEANTKTVKRRGDELREPPKKKMTKTITENQEKFGFEGNLNSDFDQSESDEDGFEESTKPSKGNVDPFFMTSDNKEYKTIWKVEPADSFKNKDKEPKEPVFVFKNARTYQEVLSGKPDKRPNRSANRKDKAKGRPEQKAVDPEKLHPSWAAKKKQNLAAVPFQGKKIVFDDD